MKKRIPNIQTKLVAVISVAIGAIVMHLSGVSCLIKTSFGFICPGCGTTRAVISLISLDFTAAFSYHPMVWSVPVLIGYFFCDGRLFNCRLLNSAVLTLIGIGYFAIWLLRLFGFCN